VRFEGPVPYERLPSYLAMCDAFVTASISEVHPLSVIEAMGAGLPVLGIQSPGVGDTVEDGKSGLLTPEDEIAFAVKMTRLVVEHDLRRQLADGARQASSLYSIERTTQIMLSHYERLAQAAEPRRHGLSFRIRRFLERFVR